MKRIRVVVAILLAILLSTSAMVASAAYVAETEPNNSEAQANHISYGTKINGSIGGSKDKDFFKFTLEEPRMLEFSLKQWGYRTSVEIINHDLGITCYKKALTGRLGTRTETFKFKRNLIAGHYSIVLFTSKTGQLGRYQLGMANLKEAAPGIALPAKKRITKGFSTRVEATASPAFFPSPEGVTYKSSAKSIATVDENTGVITGIKFGTCTITATAPNGKTAKCKVTVANNTFTRANPLTSTKKRLYISTQRMAYTGDALVIYMNVLNKTGKVFESTLDLKMDLVEKGTDSVLYSVEPRTWTPSRGVIFNNQYKTVKFVIPKDAVGLLNVGSKQYYPVVTVTNGKPYEQLGKP